MARQIVDLRAGGYTALCDALAFALVQTMQPIDGRRVLVVLSDGVGRPVRVEVLQPGLEARTVSGYWP